MAIQIVPENPYVYNNYTIRQVTITSDRVTSVDLKGQLQHLRPTSKFYGVYLINDIGNLLGTGFVEDIKVELIKYPNRQVGVNLKLTMNTTIEQIELSNMTMFKREKVLTQLQNRKGHPVNYLRISEDIRTIEKLYQDRGFFLAKVTNVFFVKNLKTLIFNIEEGLVNHVEIEGLTVMNPRIVLRNLNTKAGKPMSIEALNEDRSTIIGLGFFSKVSLPKIRPSTDSPGKYDVTFTVQERKFNNLQIGLEQLQNNKLSLALGIKLPNFRNTGEGIYFKGQSTLGSVLSDYSYYLKYTDPWFLNQHLPLSVIFWHQINQENLDNIATVWVQRTGWETNLQVPLIKGVDTIIALSNETVKDRDSVYSPYKKNSLKFILLHNTTKQVHNPVSGNRTYVQLERGSNLFNIIDFDGIEYTKYIVDYAMFFSTYKEDVLAVNISTGFLQYKSSQQLFEQDKFLVGGAYSLRGYPESYANYSNAIIGSKKFIINVEYRILFNEWLQGALFVDWGTATDGDLNVADFKLGQGAGIRIFTPLAPLRFDFAIGSNNQFILHFGLGQLF